MADWSAWLGLPKKTQANIKNDKIEPGEILGAGFDIQRGDPRLKGGVTRSNLTDSEREKLDAYRKKQQGN